MKYDLSAYTMHAPSDLDEALQLLADCDASWTPIAGGTDLMVHLESGHLPVGRYLSLWSLDALRGIEINDDAMTLGSLTTYAEIQEHSVLRTEFPMLCDAASLTGAPAIQNRGTIGGNIANASPAADSLPVLLAYDAELELVSAAGVRRVAYARFHQDYKKMDIRPDELIRAVVLPRRGDLDGALHSYRKVGTRGAQSIAKTGLAALAHLDDSGVVDHIRLAWSSVGPIPLRSLRTEILIAGNLPSDSLMQQARQALMEELRPIDDIRSSASYRSHVSGNLLEVFLSDLGA